MNDDEKRMWDRVIEMAQEEMAKEPPLPPREVTAPLPGKLIDEATRALMDHVIASERERMAKKPLSPLPPPPEPAPIHYTDLTTTDDPDWNTYVREAGRLLAEGCEGRWVLIRNGEIEGVFNTQSEASRAAVDRYFMQRVLLHPIRTWEPTIRTPTFFYRCRLTTSPLLRAG